MENFIILSSADVLIERLNLHLQSLFVSFVISLRLLSSSLSLCQSGCVVSSCFWPFRLHTYCRILPFTHLPSLKAHSLIIKSSEKTRTTRTRIELSFSSEYNYLEKFPTFFPFFPLRKLVAYISNIQMKSQHNKKETDGSCPLGSG